MKDFWIANTAYMPAIESRQDFSLGTDSQKKDFGKVEEAKDLLGTKRLNFKASGEIDLYMPVFQGDGLGRGK